MILAKNLARDARRMLLIKPQVRSSRNLGRQTLLVDTRQGMSWYRFKIRQEAKKTLSTSRRILSSTFLREFAIAHASPSISPTGGVDGSDTCSSCARRAPTARLAAPRAIATAGQHPILEMSAGHGSQSSPPFSCATRRSSCETVSSTAHAAATSRAAASSSSSAAAWIWLATSGHVAWGMSRPITAPINLQAPSPSAPSSTVRMCSSPSHGDGAATPEAQRASPRDISSDAGEASESSPSLSAEMRRSMEMETTSFSSCR
mmetsp:Transcript_495/g.1213  ORF Transcript_495/g.1213 Transcript_495/m.1213 type:complete len:261 (+) Transcript_495:97-879(+)